MANYAEVFLRIHVSLDAKRRDEEALGLTFLSDLMDQLNAIGADSQPPSPYS